MAGDHAPQSLQCYKGTQITLKAYIVTEGFSGCIFEYEIYENSNNSRKGATYNVFMRPMQKYLDQGYCVYLDT